MVSGVDEKAGTRIRGRNSEVHGAQVELDALFGAKCAYKSRASNACSDRTLPSVRCCRVQRNKQQNVSRLRTSTKYEISHLDVIFHFVALSVAQTIDELSIICPNRHVPGFDAHVGIDRHSDVGP